ncbi:MAG: hypothetical protein WBP31_03180 [Chitinophagales bacterium]|nr:hypothetical protein [Bacteroidota bacterium]MBK9555176.1 hypothetical protein [Bacteroidota bacterium]MBL0279497.1 hypothetical protein [Bacteroidota bacterium]MBP9879102.1 hypothetical protein [Chitinophagales bacterium]
MSFQLHFFRRLARWFSSLKKWQKIVSIILSFLILLIFVFFAGTFGYFGSKFQKMCNNIFYIKMIECDQNIHIPVTMEMRVNGEIEGGSDIICKSGDTIEFEINTITNVYFCLVGIDVNGIEYILPSSQDLLYNKFEKPIIATFILDNTEGNEVYYAIASPCRLKYKKDILSKLEPVQKGMKGIANSPFDLYNTEFFYYYINFKHVK